MSVNKNLDFIWSVVGFFSMVWISGGDGLGNNPILQRPIALHVIQLKSPSWDYPLTDLSIVAVLCDQACMCHKLTAKGALENVRLNHTCIQLCVPRNSTQLLPANPPLTWQNNNDANIHHQNYKFALPSPTIILFPPFSSSISSTNLTRYSIAVPDSVKLLSAMS